MMTQKEEKHLTLEEAAAYLGYGVSTIKTYSRPHENRLHPIEKDGVSLFPLSDLDAYKRRVGSPTRRTAPQTITPEAVQQPLPQAQKLVQQNDAEILQNVLSSCFAFLSAHGFAVGIQAFREIKGSLRLWEIETPDCLLRIVAEQGQMIVLADAYQKSLQEQLQQAQKKLYEAETRLAYLRKKPQQKILTEFHQPLTVLVERRETDVLVTCPDFCFVARGENEDEALAAFHRVLQAYRDWCQLHEKSLHDKQAEEYIKLDDLIWREQK